MLCACQCVSYSTYECPVEMCYVHASVSAKCVSYSTYECPVEMCYVHVSVSAIVRMNV